MEHVKFLSPIRVIMRKIGKSKNKILTIFLDLVLIATVLMKLYLLEWTRRCRVKSFEV